MEAIENKTQKGEKIEKKEECRWPMGQYQVI